MKVLIVLLGFMSLIISCNFDGAEEDIVQSEAVSFTPGTQAYTVAQNVCYNLERKSLYFPNVNYISGYDIDTRDCFGAKPMSNKSSIRYFNDSKTGFIFKGCTTNSVYTGANCGESLILPDLQEYYSSNHYLLKPYCDDLKNGVEFSNRKIINGSTYQAYFSAGGDNDSTVEIHFLDEIDGNLATSKVYIINIYSNFSGSDYLLNGQLRRLTINNKCFGSNEWSGADMYYMAGNVK